MRQLPQAEGIKRRTACLVLGVLLAGILLWQGEAGKTSRAKNFNCLIDIETEQIDDYMTFQGSQLVPIIRATVSYRMAGAANQAENAPSIKYEEIWYRAGDPLGCVRYQQLGSRELSLTQIRVSSNSQHPSQGEIQAQANALVRVYVDAYLRIALLTSVVIPDESFPSLMTSLGKENFVAGQAIYGSSLDPSILLPLESESGKSAASLYYSRTR